MSTVPFLRVGLNDLPTVWAMSPTPSSPVSRDPRIDFFRGLALIWIFLNHIPENALSWLSNRNYGFSDATEIFVFLSGYSAAMAYRKKLTSSWWEGATACWARAGDLYVAHLWMTAGLIAILVLLLLFRVPHAEGFVRLANLSQVIAPLSLTTLAEVALLKLKLLNMDVLPLYIVLMLMLPFMLRGLTRNAGATLVASVGVWLLAQEGLVFKGWVFNPFGWQLLFVCGAALALNPAWRKTILNANKTVVTGCSGLILAWSALVALSWQGVVAYEVPPSLAPWIYPISKPNLDILRLAHFFALAGVVAFWLPAESRLWHGSVARFLETLGRKSLRVFCVGILLSFLGHVALLKLPATLGAQMGISLIGILLLYTAANGYSAKKQRAAH